MCRERSLTSARSSTKRASAAATIVLDCKPVRSSRDRIAPSRGGAISRRATPRATSTAPHPRARNMPEDLRRELRSLGLL